MVTRVQKSEQDKQVIQIRRRRCRCHNQSVTITANKNNTCSLVMIDKEWTRSVALQSHTSSTINILGIDRGASLDQQLGPRKNTLGSSSVQGSPASWDLLVGIGTGSQELNDTLVVVLENSNHQGCFSRNVFGGAGSVISS
jgi:hypothetical protein